MTTTPRPLTSRDPERLGRYRLTGRLGEGGQGVVYLAEDDDGARVALKILHDRGGSRDVLLREISAARRVASFCTAEILDVGEEDGLPYVVTEFIAGPTLRELVEEKGAQSGPALYRLAIGTATALAAIHQAGIVHRDFKPGNVLVGADGPRVIDFGVARSVDATATVASTVIGTPSYMAPEQLAGQVVGTAADVFAWGAVVAYAANGRPPYGQDTIPAVLTRIVKGKPDLGDLTGSLRELVSQALRKDPGKRPDSRDVLLRLLEHSQGPIAAPEALAQGRALAMADDEDLADERTARWTTVRMPRMEQPTGGLRTRPVLLAAGVTVAALLASGMVALAIGGKAPDRGRSTPLPRGSKAPLIPIEEERTRTRAANPSAPTGSAGIATAIEQATGLWRTATFTAEGQMAESDDTFTAEGRLHFRAGGSTNYDFTLKASREADDSGFASTPRMMIIGDCVSYRDDPRRCLPLSSAPDQEEGERSAWVASEVRWVTSPYNIVELLRNATSLQRSSDAGTVTYRGSTPGARLAAGGPVAPFYRALDGKSSRATFTLVTDRDHLPKSLDIDLWSTVSPSLVYHSFYSARYNDWGTSGTITRAY